MASLIKIIKYWAVLSESKIMMSSLCGAYSYVYVEIAGKLSFFLPGNSMFFFCENLSALGPLSAALSE